MFAAESGGEKNMLDGRQLLFVVDKAHGCCIKADTFMAKETGHLSVLC